MYDMSSTDDQDKLRGSAVIVSGNQLHASQDKKALTKLNFKNLTTCTSPEELDSLLAKDDHDIILVDTELKGSDSKTFVRHIKREAKSRLMPVVMVTLENRREQVLDAISAGCSGYVLRPYSIATFEKHLELAISSNQYDEIESEQLENAHNLVTMGQFDEAIDEFEELVSEIDEAQKYFDLGMDYLREKKFGKAIIAFNKALKFNELYAEAYKGLANAHRGKGNPDKYEEFMSRAAEIFAMQDRLQEAKDAFIDILKTNPDAVNPYNTLGVDLRRKGDIQGALHAYKQAVRLTPDDENLFFNICKAYLHAQEKDNALDAITKALEINSDFKEARTIYKKICGNDWTGTSKPRSGPPALERDG